jgi:hypothetical protein
MHAERVSGLIRRVERAGAPMTTIQAVFLGIMLAMTPSIVVLAFLLWREGIGIAEDEAARSRDLYASQAHRDNQPPLSTALHRTIAGRRSFDDLNLRVVDMHQPLAQVAHIEPLSQPGHFPK